MFLVAHNKLHSQDSREIRIRIPYLFSGPSQLERFICIASFSRKQIAIGARADSFCPQRLDVVGKAPNNAPVSNQQGCTPYSPAQKWPFESVIAMPTQACRSSLLASMGRAPYF